MGYRREECQEYYSSMVRGVVGGCVASVDEDCVLHFVCWCCCVLRMVSRVLKLSTELLQNVHGFSLTHT